MVAGVAHPRRDLFGGSGRGGRRPVSSALRRLLGRWHYLVVGWAELQGPAAGGKPPASEPEVRSGTRRAVHTHISDQYAPFHTKVINATVRDATHVLDGLLYHESDLRIEEHYTDTAGFTDHLFALMHLLGFRFAPRIRDLADKRLFIHSDAKQYPTLAGLIGGNVDVNTSAPIGTKSCGWPPRSSRAR